MKTCLICGASVDNVAPSCASCGEGSFADGAPIAVAPAVPAAAPAPEVTEPEASTEVTPRVPKRGR